MKLQYKPTEKDARSSIYVNRIFQPYVGSNWHFHEEFELIYFLKGHGIRIVGDHISHFQKGELVLVGEWLPHLWVNETNASDNGSADFVVVKFTKELEGISLFSLPELAEITNLLRRSYRGIKFTKKLTEQVESILIELSKSQSASRLINLLRVLDLLSQEENHTFLASPNFSLPIQLSGENRLKKVINYISDNYSRSIPLQEIANVACITPPAFCRFFKSQTNKTFSLFLNEVRISNSCQLLINGEKSIKQICYDVGFGSLTNFNRTFRSLKGISPSEYRNQMNLILT